VPTCEGYTWVKGHFRSIPARSSQGFRTVCAYCAGSGDDPYTLANKCPACKGRGQWEFKGALSDYSTCGRCNGTGILPNTLAAPCDVCEGSGIW
jgi:molecular chaperone DnaJ